MLDQGQIRERKKDALLKLAAAFEGFKNRELDLWLDEMDHCGWEDVAKAVDKFLTRDPRTSETVRQHRPKLSDMMHFLPAKPVGESDQDAVKFWDVEGDTNLTDADIGRIPEAERRSMAKYIRDFWGERIGSNVAAKAAALAAKLDPRQEALL